MVYQCIIHCVNTAGRAGATDDTGCRMTEEVIKPEVDEPKTFTEADLKAMLERETEGLKKKVDELLTEKKTAAQRAKEAEEAAKAAAEDSARKSGDVEALEKSWKDKLTRREQELMTEVQSAQSALKEQMVTSVAAGIANEIAVPGSSKALLPHIQSRLAMEIRDGKPVTVVKDSEGKPSALTVDELKKEIMADAAFAPLIVGSKATGGGAGGGKGGGAAKTGDISSMSKDERLAYFRQKRESA